MTSATSSTRIVSFIKKEPVLIISLLAAAVSCFFVPPDTGYLEYFDFRTLALLYSLMAVVAGLKQAGVFTALANSLCAMRGIFPKKRGEKGIEWTRSTRTVGTMLVCLCFFSSMLITNDVALLTFVPFSAVVLDMAGRTQDLARVIVLQTVAANLGSMLTPVGNPQNLYLYSFYDFSFGKFLSVTAPLWLLSFFLLLGFCFFLPKAPMKPFKKEKTGVNRKTLFIHLSLFVLCLMTVIRILPWYIMLPAVIVILLIFDRKTLLKADFMLLLTFAAFFVFAGNLARIREVNDLLRNLLSGREYLTALISSQIISNVPAALLLSNFTTHAKALLTGVNIGGLGTPIASLASLIGLKLYARTDKARIGRFLLEFTAINLLLLLLLSAFYLLIV